MKRLIDELSYVKTPNKLSFRHPDIMGTCFIMKTSKGDWKAVADFYYGKYGKSREKYQTKKRFDSEVEAHSYLLQYVEKIMIKG